MKQLTEARALAALRESKAAYRSEIKLGFEHKAQSCSTCPTQGVCCTDAHFVNNHITRLEAVHIRDVLARTPRIDDAARRRIYERARDAITRYKLSSAGDTFRQTYSCPLFEPNVGCLVHARAKPAPCIQHGCYTDWEDVPPASLQWQIEHRVEKLNTAVYGGSWAWLSVPVWLALVDPNGDEAELERLARVWSTRRTHGSGNYEARAGSRLSNGVRRSLPVLALTPSRARRYHPGYIR